MHEWKNLVFLSSSFSQISLNFFLHISSSLHRYSSSLIIMKWLFKCHYCGLELVYLLFVYLFICLPWFLLSVMNIFNAPSISVILRIDHLFFFWQGPFHLSALNPCFLPLPKHVCQISPGPNYDYSSSTVRFVVSSPVVCQSFMLDSNHECIYTLFS